jgi:hypothetical protein
MIAVRVRRLVIEQPSKRRNADRPRYAHLDGDQGRHDLLLP